MPANKKKKKAATNPARGFATTSITSKPRVEKSDEPTPNRSNATSPEATAAATPAPRPNVDTANVTTSKDEPELKDLSPEELGERLEQSELQQIVDQYAAKVRRDATRQVTRLETEKRLLRGQSEPLPTTSWIPYELVQRILDMLETSTAENFSSLPKSSKPAPSGEGLLVNIWVLQLVLQELKLPEATINGAIQRVLSSSGQSSDDGNGSIWGLGTVLEWLAINCSDEVFAEYDFQRQSLPSDGSDDESFITQHIQRTSKSKRATEKTVQRRSGLQQRALATGFESKADITVSDSESDSDPEEMLSKYVQYKLRLFEHDPTAFHDLRSSSKRDATAGQSRLLQRMKNMESDPLFDRQTAEATWREKRAQALQDQAELRRLGLGKTEGSVEKQQSLDDTSAADQICRDAKEIGAEMENEGGLFEGIFDIPDSDQPALKPSSTALSGVTLRTFGKTDGYSPRRLLEETCKARDQGSRITLSMISETTYSCRHAALIQWSKDQESREAPFVSNLHIKSTKRASLIEMVGVAASGTEQSEGFICTAALFILFSGSPKEEKAALRLPPSFRDLYQEFSAARQEWSDSNDRQTIHTIRKTIEAHQEGVEDEDVVLKSAFRNRSKQNSGTTTPDSSNDLIISNAPRTDLQTLWTKKTQTPAYQEMLALRSDLPMFRFRSQALDAVRSSQVTILCGETGCGKSTQMPAFILEDQLSRGIPCRIYCTEPRRISAVSLAQRVSEELGEDKNALGTARSLVGYAIRLESQSVASTRLIYATVGIVLRMLESQDGLKDLTHLVIDEVHERSIDTDFLLIVLKTLLIQRPNLKVVLMSATVDATRFSKYLGDAPIITVPGRTFPVRDLYLEDAIEITGYKDESNGQSNHDDLDDEDMQGKLDTTALQGYSKPTIKTLTTFDEYRINYGLIMKLLEHVAYDPTLDQFSKAILVFLPGISEIRQLADMLTGHPSFSKGWLLFPLHSTFSNEEQQAAFNVPPPGMRKIVLATNIAETGITIPDVTCVIDTGKHKEMRFDEKKQLSRLIQSFISRANAKQRRGRAGRVQEGICFHLFTRQRHDTMMADQQLPEMLRLSLQDLVIRVKICKLGDIESALSEALDPPSVKNIRRAIDALIEVGALTANEELTPMGQQIARLPLDAQLGKLVLLGNIFSCLDFALTTAAIASSKSPFLAPMNAKRQADTVRLGFKRGDSDLMTAYNAYTTWRRICTSPGISEFEFCKRNFLSQQNLASIEELKGQLLSAMADAGLVSLSSVDRSGLSRMRRSKHVRNFVTVPDASNVNEASDSIISSVVAWSFYPKILVRDGRGWRSVANNQSLTLHPTSVNVLSPSPTLAKVKYLSFYSIMQSTSRFTNAQETTPVEAMALVLLAGDARFDFHSGVIIIDGNRLRFKVRTWREMAVLKALRIRAKGMLAKAWKRPGREPTEGEKMWSDLLIDILRAWDEKKTLERA